MLRKLWEYMRRNGTRLLDAHIGLGGLHLWGKLFAWYSSTLYILVFSMDWRWLIKQPFTFIDITITHHHYFKWQDRHFPTITAKLTLLGVKLLDTGKKGSKELEEAVAPIMAEYRAREAKKQELYEQWQQHMEDATYLEVD